MAFDYFAGHAVGTAQADGGVADAALGDEPADEGAADWHDAEVEQRDGDAGDDVERDAGIGGPLLERFDIAASAFAEGEATAFDEGCGGEAVAEDGPELLDDLARFINGLGSVAWLNMSDMARASYPGDRQGIAGANGSNLASNQRVGSNKTRRIPGASVSFVRRLLTEGRDRLL